MHGLVWKTMSRGKEGRNEGQVVGMQHNRDCSTKRKPGLDSTM